MQIGLLKLREFITLLRIPYCDARYSVIILGLRATRLEALHEDMK